MEVQLTGDQEAFIRRAVDSGRIHSPEEALREALVLWEEQERRRLEILVAVDRAEASLAAGQGLEITPQSVKELAEEVKRRGQARLAGAPPLR